MPAPLIAFLSDYGFGDGFAGICHAVIAGACPTARIIDLDHAIARHDVRAGASVLARAVAFLPDGAVVLADVESGEAGPRRDLAVATADGRRFVGPDNGLLGPALQAAGGARLAVDVSDSAVARRPVAATFRGRDVLAPVAAALAGGVALGELGAPVDPRTLTRPPRSRPWRDGDDLVAHVVAVDAFGNLELDAAPADLDDLGVAVGGRAVVRTASAVVTVARGRVFGDVAPGELVLYADPQQRLALAVNRDRASARLDVGLDAELRISAR